MKKLVCDRGCLTPSSFYVLVGFSSRPSPTAEQIISIASTAFFFSENARRMQCLECSSCRMPLFWGQVHRRTAHGSKLTVRPFKPPYDRKKIQFWPRVARHQSKSIELICRPIVGRFSYAAPRGSTKGPRRGVVILRSPNYGDCPHCGHRARPEAAWRSCHQQHVSWHVPGLKHPLLFRKPATSNIL